MESTLYKRGKEIGKLTGYSVDAVNTWECVHEVFCLGKNDDKIWRILNRLWLLLQTEDEEWKSQSHR